METNCISGKCECANDYAFNFDATKCLKKLSSITCSSKIDCTCEDVNSQCSSNQCVCLSGYKLNDDGTICVKLETTDSNSYLILSISLFFLILLF